PVVRHSPAELRFAVRESPRRPERGSPSQLKPREPTTVFAALAETDALALDRGTLFHCWFEAIFWLQPGNWPEKRQLIALAKKSQFATGDVHVEADEFLRLRDHPRIGRLFDKAQCIEDLRKRLPTARAATGDAVDVR